MIDSEQGPEGEVDDLQEQVDDLGDRIGEAREDWERKKADGAVPGAGGDPLAAQSDHAEGQFPGVGDSDPVGEDLDTRDPANEDL